MLDLDTLRARWRGTSFPGRFDRAGNLRDELIVFADRAGVDPRNVIAVLASGPEAVPPHIATAIETARAQAPTVVFAVHPFAAIVT
jgi:hypothetical protein